jgi:hypothetical protein
MVKLFPQTPVICSNNHQSKSLFRMSLTEFDNMSVQKSKSLSTDTNSALSFHLEEVTMPHVRKLSHAEIALLHSRPLPKRARVAQEYDTYLADFVAGDHGRAELAMGGVRLRVRIRLQAAARRRGLCQHSASNNLSKLIKNRA